MLLAAGGGAFDDLDGDMVPLCVELLAHTDPLRADTDGDGIDDFEEVLTFTSKDPTQSPRPVGYAMRALITSTPLPGGGSEAYLHLMIRFVNLQPSEFKIESLYANVAGTEIELAEMIGHGQIHVNSRHRSRDGLSYIVSIQMFSAESISWFTPCTVGLRADMGNEKINAGTLLVSAGQDLAAVLPYQKDTLIMQPVNIASYSQDSNPLFSGGGGRVCEMTLRNIGSSPGGTLCEVDRAECRPASGLRCTITCATRVGETVIIPGGIGTITGSR